MAINIERLKQIVIEQGISYTELAEKTGLTKAQISKLVNGNTGNVRPTTISRLCKGLDISYKEIYIDKGND